MSSEERSPIERMDDEAAGSDSMSSIPKSSPTVPHDFGIGNENTSNSDEHFITEAKLSQNSTPNSNMTPTIADTKVSKTKKAGLTKTKSSLVSYGRDSDDEISSDEAEDSEEGDDSDDTGANVNIQGNSQTNSNVDPIQMDRRGSQDPITGASEMITGVTLTSAVASPVSFGDIALQHQHVFPDDVEIRIPPLPSKHCSSELKAKFREFYERFKATGIDKNSGIQALKDFRNPSFYEKMITHLGIDEMGTNFPHELYDPHLWGPQSYYEQLGQAQRLEMDKREKERRERSKVAFTPGEKVKRT